MSTIKTLSKILFYLLWFVSGFLIVKPIPEEMFFPLLSGLDNGSMDVFSPQIYQDAVGNLNSYVWLSPESVDLMLPKEERNFLTNMVLGTNEGLSAIGIDLISWTSGKPDGFHSFKLAIFLMIVLFVIALIFYFIQRKNDKLIEEKNEEEKKNELLMIAVKIFIVVVYAIFMLFGIGSVMLILLITSMFFYYNLVIYVTGLDLFIILLFPITAFGLLIHLLDGAIKGKYVKVIAVFVGLAIIWIFSFACFSYKYFENNLPIGFVVQNSFSMYKNNFSLNNVQKENLMKLVSKNSKVKFIRYINNRQIPNVLICGNSAICTSQFPNIKKNLLMSSEQRKKLFNEQNDLLQSKSLYSAYDMFGLGSSYYSTLEDEIYRVNDFIVKNNAVLKEKYFIPDLVGYRMSYIYYKISFIVDNRSGDISKIYDKLIANLKKNGKYDKMMNSIDNNYNGFEQFIYKYAYYNHKEEKGLLDNKYLSELTGACGYTGEIDFNSIDNYLKTKADCQHSWEIKTFIRQMEYLKSRQNIGSIKGSISIVDQNDNLLEYGKDYEIMLSRFNNRDYRINVYIDSLKLNTFISSDYFMQDSGFVLSGVLVPDKFILIPIIYKDFNSYKFLSGNLIPFSLTSGSSNVDIGNIKIKIYSEEKTFEKIEPNKGYYYLIMNDGNVFELLKDRVNDEDGYVCTYQNVALVTKEFIKDCGYGLLMGVDYVIDFDNNEYVKVSSGDLYYGKGKIFNNYTYSSECDEENDNCGVYDIKSMDDYNRCNCKIKHYYNFDKKDLSEIEDIVDQYFVK